MASETSHGPRRVLPPSLGEVLGFGLAAGALLAVCLLFASGFLGPAAQAGSRPEDSIAHAYPDARHLLPEGVTSGHGVKPWLGLCAEDAELSTASGIAGVRRGAMITCIALEGPADEAGLRAAGYEDVGGDLFVTKPGDLIVAVDGVAISSVGDLTTYLARSGKRVGDTVVLSVLQGGETVAATVRLRECDASLVRAI